MPQRSAAAAQCAVVCSPCPSDEKIGLTAFTLRPACVLGVFFVKMKENRRKANVLFALHCLWSCCPETGCRVSKSTPLVLSTESLLGCTTGALTLLPWDPSSWRDSPLVLAIGVDKYLKMTAADGFFLEPLLRSVRKPSTTLCCFISNLIQFTLEIRMKSTNQIQLKYSTLLTAQQNNLPEQKSDTADKKV